MTFNLIQCCKSCYDQKLLTWYWDKVYSNNNIETMALYFKHQNNFRTLKLMMSQQAHIFSRILVIARCGKLFLFPVKINIIKHKCQLTKQKNAALLAQGPQCFHLSVFFGGHIRRLMADGHKTTELWTSLWPKDPSRYPYLELLRSSQLFFHQVL